MCQWSLATTWLTGCLPTYNTAGKRNMASKINPYDYEPEYSDDEGIGNVNVDKFM